MILLTLICLLSFNNSMTAIYYQGLMPFQSFPSIIITFTVCRKTVHVFLLPGNKKGHWTISQMVLIVQYPSFSNPGSISSGVALY